MDLPLHGGTPARPDQDLSLMLGLRGGPRFDPKEVHPCISLTPGLAVKVSDKARAVFEIAVEPITPPLFTLRAGLQF